MNKINFELSPSTFNAIYNYAKYLNLNITIIIRYFLSEQIHSYNHDESNFASNYKNCKFKKTSIESETYEYLNRKPKKYSFYVSDYIYNGLQAIQKQYEKKNNKTNVVVNNLLHISLRSLELESLHPKYSISNDSGRRNTLGAEGITKQYAIPLSVELSTRLDNISITTGIKKNQLMSIIISNYLIDHSAEYEEDMFIL